MNLDQLIRTVAVIIYDVYVCFSLLAYRLILTYILVILTRWFGRGSRLRERLVLGRWTRGFLTPYCPILWWAAQDTRISSCRWRKGWTASRMDAGWATPSRRTSPPHCSMMELEAAAPAGQPSTGNPSFDRAPRTPLFCMRLHYCLLAFNYYV